MVIQEAAIGALFSYLPWLFYVLTSPSEETFPTWTDVHTPLCTGDTKKGKRLVRRLLTLLRPRENSEHFMADTKDMHILSSNRSDPGSFKSRQTAEVFLTGLTQGESTVQKTARVTDVL